MKCSDVLGLFSEAFDDALKEPVTKDFFSHLEECGRCKCEYDDYSKSLIKLASLQLVKAPDIEERVISKASEIGERQALTGDLDVPPARSVERIINIKQIVFVAAMFVGVFFAGYYLRSILDPTGGGSVDKVLLNNLANINPDEMATPAKIAVDTHGTGPCCSVPVDCRALDFKSLSYIMPEEEFFSEVYLLLQPVKLDENFKIYVLTGEPMPHRCYTKEEMVSKIAFSPAETGMKASPLMLTRLNGSHFAGEIARFLCGSCEYNFDYKSQDLLHYVTSIVRKPRGLIIVFGDNIHSFIACRDGVCLESVFDYFLQSSYLDYNLLKSAECINKYKFDPDGLSSIKDKLVVVKDGGGISYMWGVFSEVVVDPAGVSRAISSMGGVESSLVKFPSARLFSKGATLNALRDVSVYCRLVRDNFDTISKGTRLKVKKHLFNVYHSDPEGLAKNLISSLYTELTGARVFNEKDFGAWVSD